MGARFSFYLGDEDAWMVRALEMMAQKRERTGTKSSRNIEVREILREALMPLRSQIIDGQREQDDA